MTVIGIDLGTTRSSIAYFDGEKPVIIPNLFGELSIPSKVILSEDGKFHVGREAENHPKKYESHHFTIGSIKRMIDYPDGIILNGKRHYPQVISALVLAELKRQAESYLKTTINEAVICIPCNFGTRQRCATIDAAEIAGFKVLRILNEATAAALAYTFMSDSHYEGKECVFDLGGGTLDLSLIDYAQGVIEVKQVEGEERLGGDDFDDKIIKYIVNETRKTQGFDPIEDQTLGWDHIAKLRLKEAAETAKIALSSQNKTRIYIPYIRNILGKAQHIDLELTEETFETLCEDLSGKILQLIDKIVPVLQDNYHIIDRQISKTITEKQGLIDKLLSRKPKKRNISETVKDKQYLRPKFVYTGGASKIKYLRNKIESKHKGLNFISRDKDVVALGAAIQGGIVKGLCKDWLILDCTAKSFGIGLEDDKYEVIFPKNTTVPSLKKGTYTTTVDNQSHISLKVYEGNSEKASQNKKIVDLEFDHLLAAKAGVPKVEVCFKVGIDNVLCIKAKDLGSDKIIEEIGDTSSYVTLDPNIKREMRELIKRWIAKRSDSKNT